MNKTTLIYFDTEFTELGIDPRLVSIGLISEQGDRTFYAELSDTYQCGMPSTRACRKT